MATKTVELESQNSCFNKALASERLFVLLARDPAAPAVIRAWIGERLRLGLNMPEDKQIKEASECANLMELEQEFIQSAVDREKGWRQQNSVTTNT